MGKKIIILGADFEANAIEQGLPPLEVQFRVGQIEEDNSVSFAYPQRQIIAIKVNESVSNVAISIKNGYKISSGIYYNGADLDLATLTSSDSQAHITQRQSPWAWHQGNFNIPNISGTTYIMANIGSTTEGTDISSKTFDDFFNSIVLS